MRFQKQIRIKNKQKHAVVALSLALSDQRQPERVPFPPVPGSLTIVYRSHVHHV